MTPASSRRQFLETAGATAGLGMALAAGTSTNAAALTVTAPGQPGGAAASARPKVAALASTYFYLSHAYHIVGRFLDGFPVYDGQGKAGGESGPIGPNLHVPPFEIASLYIEQVADATDLGRAKAKKHGVRLSPTIADALTLGTGKLAVDAVLLIAEHGDYPLNAKLQKLYPRGRYFRQVLDVFRASGRSVPVFIDKHLSYSRTEAQQMVDQARALNVPLMAGSSLPVTWRLPELEIPLGRPVKDVARRLPRQPRDLRLPRPRDPPVHGRAPRPARASPRASRRSPAWKATPSGTPATRGVWSWELLRHALGRSHSVNPGDIRQNTRDFAPPPLRDSVTMVRVPTAFLVEYTDGLRATVLILNGHVDDTTVAVRTVDATGKDTIVSTLTYLPAPPAPASSTRWSSGSRTSSRPARPPTPSNAPS